MGMQKRKRRRKRLGTSEAAQVFREPLLPRKSDESDGLQGSGRSAWLRASRRPWSSGGRVVSQTLALSTSAHSVGIFGEAGVQTEELAGERATLP